MKTIKDLSLLLGRILISAVFILSLFHRFTLFNSEVEMTRANGLTFITVFWVCAATLFEFTGTLLILTGLKVQWGSFFLMVFLIPVTLIFHHFWTATGMDAQTQMGHFFSNIGLLGGLFMIIGNGAGKYSIDYFLSKKSTPL